jgi:hypothetical protein
VEWVVSSWDRSSGLSREQRRRLVGLILEETQPLKRYGRYDRYAVIFQASRLPPDKLKSIVPEPQWRLLRAEFEKVQEYERRLIAEGYLSETMPDAQ